MWSRDLSDLLLPVKLAATAHAKLCADNGITIIETSTYRSSGEQAKLYAIGRTEPGSIRTNAKPGKSFHQYRVARDVVPIVDGKAVWDDFELWQRIGALGEQVGFEWAGSWKTFREFPHFQVTAGLGTKEFSKMAVNEAELAVFSWLENKNFMTAIG
ncbi:hypothetical protein MNBD_NITROSPINAE01-421 [hydrothermal vent metagenome]|uniref:Peptidase M15C domain-containing protein n=1 Tax=hydrothermal vent metagenome TaxID=652676 RepID=A0A3B1BSP4_9ZZZZ